MSSKITVYIPSYNQIVYLKNAIESVLAQTRLPDQILVVDDASTDGSDELIRSYQREHPELIDTIVNDTNQGIGSVRRIAVNASTGDLITYLDGDDLYYPKKLELEEQALLENPYAGYVYSNFEFIDTQGEKEGVWSTQANLPEENIFDLHWSFGFPRGIASRCELVRREVLIKTDHYESGLNLYQTLDTMLRVSRCATCVAINEPTQAYRRHAQGRHRTPYAFHYDTLNHIFTKNKDLLDGLDDARKRRLQSKIDLVLSQFAWRAIKQVASSNSNETRSDVLQYAKAGFSHRPVSVLNPKHSLRAIRAYSKA